MVKPTPMLMIPGPTPVPDAVLSELAFPPMGHRSGAFKDILLAVQPKLQWLFQTQRLVHTYAASATGAMEAALVNTLNPGDEIVVCACGVFSQRWANIAKKLGITVHLQQVPSGQPTDMAALATLLSSPEGQGIKAVCLIHNETSTGVINPLETMAKDIRRLAPNALIIVDTVTGLGAAPFQMDDWDLDIAVSGSQKGFMLPPGLAFITISERAMAMHQQCQRPGFYFNFTDAEKNTPQGQTPWTSATTLIRGLLKALELMEEEGLPGMHQRHQLNQRMTQAAMKAMGLSFFVPDPAYASPSVTAVCQPEGLEIEAIRKVLRDDFAITIAAGQAEMKGKIFRIGHLGAIFPRDVLTTVGALEATLHKLGWKQSPLGAGVAAAQQEWIDHG